MKKIVFLLAVIITSYVFYNFNDSKHYKDGDIIFQTTGGPTGKAIQLATHSQYNHCGILFFENNEWMVYEAVQPVKRTSLTEFNTRGKGTVKRLSNQALTKQDITKLKSLFKIYENKNYDEAFNWSDDQIYCSELVYKLYNNALKIELCKPRKLSDFDLSNPLVKEKLTEKYGHKIPLNEPMVSPEDIFRSSLLSDVK
ncbi:MAG: YiiX family permuted papain-like enzyme [Bacteroidetes bacterium]|nr:YiiX family permuted papain-like enzyme [Bacteroidota bacterium]